MKEQGGIPLQAVKVEVACALDTKHTAIRRPSSPIPSLPESVDSWSSDVLAESHDQLVSQGYWNNSSSANSRFQDEDCAIDNLHLGLQVDLFDFLDDEFQSSPDAVNQTHNIPRPPPPPSCTLDWPQSPHSATIRCTTTHDADISLGQGIRAAGTYATSLGDEQYPPRWWPELDEGLCNEGGPPDMACHLRHRRAQTWPAATYDGEYSGVLSAQLQGPSDGVSLQFLIDDMGGIMAADAPGFRYSPKPLPNGCDCHLSRSSPGSSSTCGSSTASTSSSSQQSSRRSTSASSISSDTGPAPSGMSVRRPLSTDHGPSHSDTSYGVTPARPAHSDNPAPGGHKRRWSSLSFHLKRLSGAFDSLQTYGAEHSSTSPGSGQGHYLRARDVGSNMPTHYNRRPPSMPVSPFSDGSELSDIDHNPRHFDRQEECDDRAEDEQSQRSGYSEASRHDASRDDRRASLPAYGDQSSHTQSVHLGARMSLRSLGSAYPECSSPVSPSNALRFSSLHLDLKDSELYYLRELPATPSPPPALEVTPFASCTSFGILEDTLVDCSPTLAPSLPPGSILPPLLDSNNDGDQSQASRNPSPLLSSASSGALTPPGHLLSTPLDLHSHQMLPDTVPIELVSDSLGDTQPLRSQRSSAHSHPNSPSITPKVSHETFVFGDLHPTNTPDISKPYDQDMQPRSVDFNDAALSRLTGSRYDAHVQARNDSGDYVDSFSTQLSHLQLHSQEQQASRPPSRLAPSPIPPTDSLPATSQWRSDLSFNPADQQTPYHGEYRDTSDRSTSSRRESSSRYSSLTQTSISSENSVPSTSASSRHHTSQSTWGSENRPTVPTVLEEETLDDIALRRYEQDLESLRSTSRQGSHILGSVSSSPRKHSGIVRANRASIISSTSSTRTKQSDSHPFAIRRERSPSQLDDSEMLAGPLQHPKGFSSHYGHHGMATDLPSPHQVALVSAQEDIEEVICPVCCESLRNRLPGEKPHIVPECGHGLHEECFIIVYGPVPHDGSRRNIGVCGVCRAQMRVASGGHERISQKKNKLATLMGGDISMPLDLPPGVDGGFDNINGDDPVEGAQTVSPGGSRPSEALSVVVPAITIKSEQPSVRRNRKEKQSITCMVTIEVPPAVDQSFYPARSRYDDPQGSPGLPSSPFSTHSSRDTSSIHGSPQTEPPAPFANVLADLRRRVVDYRTQGLDAIGSLKLFDILSVQQGSEISDFNVYLFESAMVCVQEQERKSSSFRNLFERSNRSTSQSGVMRSVLKVKGLIHHAHVREVKDMSTKSQYSIELTVDTDNRIDKFQLTFTNSSSHEMWKNTIRRLVDESTMPLSRLNRLQSTPSQSSFRGGKITPPLSAGMQRFPSYSPACSGSCPGDLAYQISIARHHTPIDLVIVISTPTPTPSSSGVLPLKQRLMKSSLQFVLASLGPRDRVSLISAESGLDGAVRKTPLLNATRHNSRLRLENFIDGLGVGRLERDEFSVPNTQNDQHDVVAALNIGLDVVLGRRIKNPITGLLLISDTNDTPRRADMALVNARLDAAMVQVHAFGYGKSHDPSSLWVVSNHTRGTYTFVKEWYHLRDALAGVLGGLMSVALTNMKLRLTCQDAKVRVSKVSGASMAVVSRSGREVDIELAALRHNELREILVAFELMDEGSSPSTSPTSAIHRTNGSMIPGMDEDMRSQYSSAPSMSRSSPRTRSQADSPNPRPYEDELHDEVPVVEVDCSFHDPQAGRSASRLANPVLLTLPILPLNAPPNGMGEPSIIRRRMELLTSEMMTRAVMAASRKNFGQAKLTLTETKRIVEKMADDMRRIVNQQPPGARSRREIAMIHAVEGLTASTQDVDYLLDGLEEGNRPLFEIDHRNYAAQQSVILRTQRSWTVRTPTELHYATPAVRALIQASAEYAMRS